MDFLLFWVEEKRHYGISQVSNASLSRVLNRYLDVKKYYKRGLSFPGSYSGKQLQIQ